MAGHPCSIQGELIAATEQVLKRIAELTNQQLALFQAPGRQISMKLDRDLEEAVGEKERLFGALRQHRSDHGC
jgi:hypothetical protein